MKHTLFSAPWFYNTVTRGFGAALLGKDEDVVAFEASLIDRLVLHLLDRQKAGDSTSQEALSFYGFCQRNLQWSHSQILQDLWVLYMLGEKRDGFFVEFGACDGIVMSNTKLLEDAYGWTGILAEPNPVWHAALARNRKANISSLCVHSQTGKKVRFLNTQAMPELSRVADIVPDDIHEKNGNRRDPQELEVETISLLDLLDRHSAPTVIDYISIDTEGSELEILSAFDFSRYSFRLMTIEHAGETAKRNAIADLLKKHGYAHWHRALSRWDDWFIKLDTD